MDWLTSLPAVIAFVTAPLMVLLMVDALRGRYSARSDQGEDGPERRIIPMVQPKRRGHEPRHRFKKAA